MHGVSHVLLSRGFERFGFKPFIPVKEQQNPDPEFPTVKFPNPEEAGMSIFHPPEMVPRLRPNSRCSGKLKSEIWRHGAEAQEKDLAIRTAEATGASYVLAQDPDADRFSAAERRYGYLWYRVT
jgi:phosphomannomutase